MISGYSHRLASGLLLATVAAALLGSGCSSDLDWPRYPTSLRYQDRQDLLIKTPPAQQLATIPPPGRLDESIRKASESKTVTKFDPKDVSKADHKEIRQALLEVFGTPARPSVEPIDPDSMKRKKGDEERYDELKKNRDLFDNRLGTALQNVELKPADIEDLKVDAGTLSRGSMHYRRHCMHCHGLNGDGRGPTGPWVSPHPRDYRQGKFKFISTSLTASNRKPRRADLLRTLAKGIEGTSMPAFGLLSEKELDEIVSYVIHLSVRGQVEYDTIEILLTNKKPSGESDKEVLEGGSIQSYVYYRSAVLLAAWVDSTKRPAIPPPAYPYEATDRKTEEGKAQIHTAVRNGYQLFLNANKGGCISCHTDFGRQVLYNYDDWGTLVQPRNLTAEQYRGGRRPLDIYWRIAGGIEPSGMKATANLSPQEYWDLVEFVQALPYPRMLPEDVRKKVYGDSDKAPVPHASR